MLCSVSLLRANGKLGVNRRETEELAVLRGDHTVADPGIVWFGHGSIRIFGMPGIHGQRADVLLRTGACTVTGRCIFHDASLLTS